MISSSYDVTPVVIFQLPEKDVDYLNSLTNQLVRLANLRHGQVQYLERVLCFRLSDILYSSIRSQGCVSEEPEEALWWTLLTPIEDTTESLVLERTQGCIEEGQWPFTV